MDFPQQKKSWRTNFELILGWIVGGAGFSYFTVYLAFKCQELSKDIASKERGLVEGYFGFRRDMTDFQWRNFRDNLYVLWIFFSLFIGISNLLRRVHKEIFYKIFALSSGLVFAIYLHGIKIIYLLLILLFHFLISHRLEVGLFFTIFTWTFCCVIKIISFEYKIFDIPILPNTDWCKFEWFFVIGLIMLRMISFSLELQTAKKRNRDIKIDLNHCNECKNFNYCQKFLVNCEITLDEFNLVNYITYIFYPPLYFTGPTVTFNSFAFQLSRKSNPPINRDKLIYLIRYIFLFFSIETYNHMIYPNLFLTNSDYDYKLKNEIDSFTLTILCFFLLVFVWIKFNFIWKTARIFALFDGIETEENMNRCIINNYCFEGFWRAWHRSFNQWLIKYIFIPMGGKKFKLVSIWIIFTFVALWHELELKLLIWALVICVCLIPENLVKSYFNKPERQNLEQHIWFRALQNLGAGFMIIMLIISNLIGFGFGYDGFLGIIKTRLKDYLIDNFIFILLFLSAHSISQFHIREIEARNNKNINY